MKQLTAGSLFSGVGMFDLAFAVAGFDILFQVEIDTFCQKVLKKHAQTYWSNAKIHADVCSVGRHNLPSVDVLFGGFPCTDISVAGKGEGIQVGTRSGLWFEFKRIIGEIRPRVVLLENVAAITRKDGTIVISDLASMGYDCKWGVISAADTEAPHLRERWWCVAHDTGARAWGHVRDMDTQEGCNQGLLVDGGCTVDLEHADIERREERDNTIIAIEACNIGRRSDAGSMVNPASQRCEGFQPEPLASQSTGTTVANRSRENGIKREGNGDQSRLGGIADGTSSRMDGYRLMSHVFPVGPNMPQPDSEAPRMAPGNKNTNARLKALGNGGLPQIVYPIAVEIAEMLSQ